jgi:hypothetical protein
MVAAPDLHILAERAIAADDGRAIIAAHTLTKVAQLEAMKALEHCPVGNIRAVGTEIFDTAIR